MILRELYSVDDPAFEAAYRLYEASFPVDEREPRAVIEAWLRPTGISSPGQAAIKRFVVAERDAEVVGLTIHEFRPACGLGWLIYIAVEPSCRGTGLGARLLEAVRGLVRLDASFRGVRYRGMILEVERVEDATDEADRVVRKARLAYFGQRGARLLTSDYVQPSLGEGLRPVPLNLLILDGEPDASIVRDFYRHMWGIG